MSISTIPLHPKENIDSNAHFYFRLASETPTESADDTESIYSIQGKETDIVKDTSDTATKSESEYDIDVEIEYDIGSLSGSVRDDNGLFDLSSDSDDMMLAAATVACDSSLVTFITDAEDSDNSRQDDSSLGLTDFWTCIQ